MQYIFLFDGIIYPNHDRKVNIVDVHKRVKQDMQCYLRTIRKHVVIISLGFIKAYDEI